MIRDFTDLQAWRKSHLIAIDVYKLVKIFPTYEQYGLADQIRRASVSVTSNIAEGFGRQTKKERLQFYYMASGSLTELRNQVYLAKDVGYIDQVTMDNLIGKIIEAHRTLYGLIRSSKSLG